MATRKQRYVPVAKVKTEGTNFSCWAVLMRFGRRAWTPASVNLRESPVNANCGTSEKLWPYLKPDTEHPRIFLVPLSGIWECYIYFVMTSFLRSRLSVIGKSVKQQ